jgi:ubiquinone/menaquinone biosynthesis C-methylase UbiE
LNHRVKIAGIRHHRDYIHPSCLMISRQTLEDFDLTFLDEKDRPSRLDVAERISCEIKRHGFEISGLDKTAARRRGSVSEPVYLGTNYQEIVYHQWYTTRAVISSGRQVDDVPMEALNRSLREVIEEYNAEPRDITVVVGVRAAPGQPRRLRNARAALWALNLQNLERWRYRIVIVEQDREPRLKNALAPLGDHYIFAYNPGPYNRSWAFNIGAWQNHGKTGTICFLDADLLVQADFLNNGLNEMKTGHLAVCPFSEMVYLDSACTDQAIKDRLEQSNHSFNAQNYKGRVFTDSQGGAIWVELTLYMEIGGHNEGFRGWGYEDREFWDRLARKTNIKRLPGRLLHLHHPPPQMQDPYALANQKLYRTLSLNPPQEPSYPPGDLKRYTFETPRVDMEIESSFQGRRDWENWHRWKIPRIENIVYDEKRHNSQASARYQLVSMLVQLGNRILDVGCGPGALWPYLAPYRPRVSWVGTDITHKMLKISQGFSPQVPVCNADAGELPFGDNSFDVVVLRHVLEHLPPWLMCRALRESMRVAIKSVVLVFYVPPVLSGSRQVRRVGENFLETQWTVKELENILLKDNWRRCQSLCINGGKNEKDTVWVINPTAAAHANADKKPMPTLNEKLKISIIMPTYKRPHSIFRTVETIRQQVYNNWELIIIDNEGGTGYDFHDPCIRLYCHNARTGASYARNQGVQYATGNLVCFFDDDDDMFPGYLERFAHAFQQNPDAKMVRCGMLVSNDQINFSYATPECCLRREFATPTWRNSGQLQDQHYFKQIISRNRWSEKKGDIIVIDEALCRANNNPYGGLRSGKY